MKKFIVLLILLLPVVTSLMIPGYFGASDDLHIAWLQQMDKTLRLGQWPPRYVPDLSFGFGYPLFNFVYPLPFYIGELFHVTGFSFVDSMKIVLALSLIASGYAMYLWIKDLGNEQVAMVGALMYVYTPYRATDVYVRGAVGEALAFVFLPLIGWSIIRLKQTGKWRWVGAYSLSVLGLILSHNITTYMTLPLFGLLGFWVLGFKNLKKFLIANLMAGLSGIYFWLPALIDSGLMKYDAVFNYLDHNPTLRQLFTPYWGYGASVPGPYDGMSFYMGTMNIIVIFFAVVVLIWNHKAISKLPKIIIGWSLLIWILAMGMMNYRSQIFWEWIPLVKYFQFPWRLLTITTLASSVLTIVFVSSTNKFRLIFIGLMVGVVGINAYQFRPHDFLGRTDEYYLNRYIPTPIPSAEYLTLQEEYLRLPKRTSLRPDHLFPQVFPITSEILNIKTKNDLDITFSSQSSHNLELSLNKYNFPGWKVTIDNKVVPVVSGQPYGQVSFEIPAGTHQVHAYFSETAQKVIYDWISILAIIISLICLL